MFKSLADLIETARLTYLTEGRLGLVRWGLRQCYRRIYYHQTYILYELAVENITKLKQSALAPKIESFKVKIISSNRELQDLKSGGICIRPWYPVYSKYLDHGAVALCVLMGQELIHIGWIALSKKALGNRHPPLEADFKNKEAVTFGSWTNPKYRGKHLMTYGHFKILEYLRERGISVLISAVSKENISSRKVVVRLGNRIHGEGRLIKILWWRWWKEETLQD